MNIEKIKKMETNDSALKKLQRRKDLSCSYCPPNKVENSKRGKPSRSWKDRTKRRRQSRI